MKLRLFLGEKQVTFNQNYEVMAEIVSGAFGGKKNNDNVQTFTPKTGDEAVLMFNRMFK